jgi:sugar O-acyltransferase (sialic acid O-acetyltransferase NeuD family)
MEDSLLSSLAFFKIMKQLIIIGTGNLGKIIHDLALESSEFNKQWEIKGFLGCRNEDTQADECYPAMVGLLNDYSPMSEDVFICALTQLHEKRHAVEVIENKGGKFINLIHKNANINRTAMLGKGITVGAYTTISVHSVIEDHVTIQDHCNIGHDSTIKPYCNLYVGVLLSGKNLVEESVSLFTGSTVYPNIKIKKNATVGAGSVVMRHVKEGTTVLGNPAKKFE